MKLALSLSMLAWTLSVLTVLSPVASAQEVREVRSEAGAPEHELAQLSQLPCRSVLIEAAPTGPTADVIYVDRCTKDRTEGNPTSTSVGSFFYLRGRLGVSLYNGIGVGPEAGVQTRDGRLRFGVDGALNATNLMAGGFFADVVDYGGNIQLSLKPESAGRSVVFYGRLYHVVAYAALDETRKYTVHSNFNGQELGVGMRDRSGGIYSVGLSAPFTRGMSCGNADGRKCVPYVDTSMPRWSLVFRMNVGLKKLLK